MELGIRQARGLVAAAALLLAASAAAAQKYPVRNVSVIVREMP
jgi:tripartite-type tricarboxylate transporter receptor subunit TctC